MEGDWIVYFGMFIVCKQIAAKIIFWIRKNIIGIKSSIVYTVCNMDAGWGKVFFPHLVQLINLGVRFIRIYKLYVCLINK